MNIDCPSCDKRIGTDVHYPHVPGLTVSISECPHCGYSHDEELRALIEEWRENADNSAGNVPVVMNHCADELEAVIDDE